jgi:DNA mismatch repair protein MutS2
MASHRYLTDLQTLQELQFPEILEQLKSFTISKSATEMAGKLRPIVHKSSIQFQLLQTHQRLSIIAHRRATPGFDFEELLTEIKYLKLEDAVLSLEGIVRIYKASDLVNQWLTFFSEQSGFPELAQVFSSCYATDAILQIIVPVVDVHQTQKIKDDASPALYQIRSSIKSVRHKINRNFEKEMRKLQKDGWLGETHETFISERRVLTVLSGYKRRVPGSVVGTSKTGSLTYIEPMVNRELNHELDCLLEDEKKEEYKILKSLSQYLRAYLHLIESYQKALVQFDFISAKARLAMAQDATLPSISTENSLYWKEAYHPILVATNEKTGRKTVPQGFILSPEQRFLVISGPNAGGKSLALKTVGLLQCMLQSGLLIPLHQDSQACIFQQLFSDIGDNQSIENELSTYSYRLKRMKYFLERANPNVLLLLDEFGSGSDPELGSALAEVFFEQLYASKCFAILTTHYSAIKVRASEMPEAVNGAMKFDVQSLRPLYELALGLPGSSFTFEVAAINGIPPKLIKEAKQKLSSDTKRLNQLLSTLQQEKQYFQKMIQEYKNAQKRMEEELVQLRKLEQDTRGKSKQLSQQAEEQAKQLQLGQRFEKYMNRYQPGRKKQKENEQLYDEIKSFIVKSKSIPAKPKKPKKSPENTPEVVVEFKPGDRVKIKGTRQIGVVDSIEKNKMLVLVNSLKIAVTSDKLAPHP